MPIVVQLPCPVRCRQSKSGKKILSSKLLWIFHQQHVQRGTACSVVEYVKQIMDCDVKNERQVLRTPRIWHPKNREFFFAWMWSNTADAIMFVTWCHTTQLEGVNFYYVKGQLIRRLDVWSKLIENDWLKKKWASAGWKSAHYWSFYLSLVVLEQMFPPPDARSRTLEKCCSAGGSD